MARGHSYEEALQGFAAKHVYDFDKHHLDLADIGILLMPAGKSGHLEFGYLIGRGRPCFMLFDETPERYDVMYQLATKVCFSSEQLMEELSRYT